MQTENLITVSEFCSGHQIDSSFIGTLHQFGFIELTAIEQTNFLVIDDLPRLEKIIRLHNELDINLEGIDAIIYLLEKINSMENEMRLLRNRLKLYEED
jgi:hypothetical protein